MMYAFMPLDDQTEIVHSEMRPDEKLCFCHVTCYLLSYLWGDIADFSKDDISRFQELIESIAHLILYRRTKTSYI